MRDARRTLASLPLLRTLAIACACALAGALPAAAQQPRPWLDWRTTESEHFVFHYPSQYREWTLSLARRMEGIREQVRTLVGYAPARRVHIVVDDPANDANGTAYSTLDAPTIVLFPTPPSPREEIGNYRVWNELVATHEYAHIAHLGRPSRNRLRSFLYGLSPVPLGPIALDAPRWAIEGYATYIEGRVTGTGRPNHAWRAAVLRQFALEGRLPGYAQLSATGGWETGSFAYLAGSAYLEWLARREGDSSITAVWRRMSARTPRSFDQAFSGVYGRSPAALYSRFVAELTADALALERSMGSDSVRAGTLIQRLSRNTGDPAVSPDGRFVALAVRVNDLPIRVVVWRTAEEPDTLARARERAARRDPDDVPARAIFPPPREEVISLIAEDGAPYESPRWFADNRHLLLSRLMPRSDGTLRPDLFRWNATDGDVERLTTGASVSQADPSPSGEWAAAIRCERGWCDLVRVDLKSAAVQLLRAGGINRTYYRPRISRESGVIAVSEQVGDRWRILLVDPATGASQYADPEDNVSRYDATFTPDGRSLIAVSEREGIPNLERLDQTTHNGTSITAVTGAAVAPDVAPDGGIWFLSLHAGGYDLRRTVADSGTIAASALAYATLRRALVDSSSPALPPARIRQPADSATRPTEHPIDRERAYGVGPSRFRYLPALESGFGGSSVLLAVSRTDPVGRLGLVARGVLGTGALPAGLSATITSRRSRWVTSGFGWLSHEAPSRIAKAAGFLGLDLFRAGGGASIERERISAAGSLFGGLSLLGEWQQPARNFSHTRTAAVSRFSVTRRQRDEDSRYIEELSTLAEAGFTGGGSYLRQRSTLIVGVARETAPFSLVRLAYGTVGGGEGSGTETFVLGGIPSPLVEEALDARRVSLPAYPLASAFGSSFAAYRISLPVSPVEVFYSGASPDLYRTALRSYGAEYRGHLAGIPPLGTPAVDFLTGFARAVDQPVAGEWRFYLAVGVSP